MKSEDTFIGPLPGASPLRYAKQVTREKALRQSAIGARVKSIQEDATGIDPVLRRWVNASVVPTAKRFREACTLIADTDPPDFEGAGEVLGSPTFGVVGVTEKAREVLPLLKWMLKGRSPGRTKATGDTTHAEDVVLASLGYLLRRIAVATEAKPCTLNSALGGVAEIIRETVTGQWIVSVQGAGAMARLETYGGEGWRRGYKLKGVANLLLGQVKPQLAAQERGEVELEIMGAKTVLKVIDPQTHKERRIDLKPPSPEDWRVLDMARRGEAGGRDPYQTTWLMLALMVICCAQRELGWFEIGLKGKSDHRKAKKRGKLIGFSDEARNAIAADVEAWTQLAFLHAPMLHPPKDGGYLTVKMKKVSQKGAPHKHHTDAEGTTAWKWASKVMAGTAWNVNTQMLDHVKESPGVTGSDKATAVIAEHSRLAQDTFWLPIYFDFRGRVYYRGALVNYQGDDLQKSLLQFEARTVPSHSENHNLPDSMVETLAVYACGLEGKHDKGTLREQRNRYLSMRSNNSNVAILNGADKPYQLQALLQTHALDLPAIDRIPIQLDGTCNGLQHLSAMFGDEVAAPFVNLVNVDPNDEGPADIYKKVADIVQWKLTYASSRLYPLDPFVSRMNNAITIDRKITKRSVMVLPYGGTLTAIRSFVTAAVLAQEPNPAPWVSCLRYDMEQKLWVADEQAEHDGYLAFENRPLELHPLFKQDMHKLADIVWAAIEETLPRALWAMKAFKTIGEYVGDNILEWRTRRDLGYGVDKNDTLWVKQARMKSQAKRTRLKGLHLPESVRSLLMLVGSDEVDKSYHRTGIVANLIHSCDAAHLARTMGLFHMAGLRDFAAVHDCFATRLTQVDALREMIRNSFMWQYQSNPLAAPVRIVDPKTGEAKATFTDWYDLALCAGTRLPDQGKWRISDMDKSYWFFS